MSQTLSVIEPATEGVLEEPAPDAQIASVGREAARIVAHGWVDVRATGAADARSRALTAAHAALRDLPKAPRTGETR